MTAPASELVGTSVRYWLADAPEPPTVDNACIGTITHADEVDRRGILVYIGGFDAKGRVVTEGDQYIAVAEPTAGGWMPLKAVGPALV